MKKTYLALPLLVLLAAIVVPLFLPFGATMRRPLAGVPSLLVGYQTAVVAALIPLGWGPVSGFVLALLLPEPGASRRPWSGDVVALSAGFMIVSYALYSRWLLQPLVFVHGIPYPNLNAIGLWAVAGGVALWFKGRIIKAPAPPDTRWHSPPRARRKTSEACT